MSHNLNYSPGNSIGSISKIHFQDERLKDGAQLFYLDTVIGETTVDETPNDEPHFSDGFMSKDFTAYASMELKAKTINLPTIRKRLKYKDTEDPYSVIDSHLTSVVIGRMLELSKENKNVVADHFPSGLDLDYGNPTTWQATLDANRKLLLRMLNCAAVIQKQTRRSVPDFVIIDPMHIGKLISKPTPGKLCKIEDSFFSSFNIVTYEGLGNKVIVGCSNHMDGALYIATSKDDIGGSVEGDEIEIAYILAECPNTNKFYLQFDIL